MDKKEKAHRKKIITCAAAALVVVLLAVLPMLSARQENLNDIQATVVSAQAEIRDIDTVLIGGGQLSSSGEYSIQIPENVKLTELLVGNGDAVKEGDPIALVDRVTVLSAIADVEETLKELSEQINTADNSAATSTVTAEPGGRIKAIYSEVGDSVQDIMLHSGALAVISLDDLMAVKLSAQTTYAPGDKLKVLIGDELVSGRVTSNVNAELTVTVEDNSYPIGQKATVYNEDGWEMGSASLYVYNAWNAIAYSGTVTRVYVSENQLVYAGQTLFSVTESGKSAAWQTTLDKRQKYEALEATLFQMYRSGVISAPCDGIVSGIDTAGVFMLANETGGSGIRLTLLSNITMNVELPEETPKIYITTDTLVNGMKGKPYSAQLTLSEEVEGVWSIDGLPAGLSLDAATGWITGTPTETVDAAGLSVSFTFGDTTIYKAVYLTIEKGAEAQYTAYIAKVIDGSSKGGSVKVNYSESSYTITDLNNLPSVSAEELELTQEAIYANNVIGGADLNKGDIFWAIFNEDGELCKVIKINSNREQPGGDSPGSGGGFSGRAGGSGGMGASGSTGPEEDDGLYSLETVTVATVTSQEQMTVSVSIDELDITQIHIGQSAKITMNAIAVNPVNAIVKGIANEGENNGGNSKFTVEFELEKSSQMLPGMNATASIVLDTAKNALCVPAAAVYERDGKLIIYTSYDAKDDQLGSPIEVTIGSADADFVQILSGLKAGTTVYYETYKASVGFPLPDSAGADRRAL